MWITKHVAGNPVILGTYSLTTNNKMGGNTYSKCERRNQVWGKDWWKSEEVMLEIRSDYHNKQLSDYSWKTDMETDNCAD